MNDSVLVIGGTGKTGARLVERLLDEGWPVRAASRSGLAAAGAQGVAFDWFDADGHAAALAGVDRVYLVAPVGAAEPLTVMAPFIERALACGVRRFVLLSSSLLEEGGPAMGAVHAFLHRRVPEWAVLRPSWFMENFATAPHLATICDEGAIYSATDDGLVPFISVDDIAEVALRVLTSPHAANAGLVLTGPDALSYDAVAVTVGAAAGRPVRHVRLTAEALAERFEASGLPPNYAAMLAGLDRAIAAGAEARTTSTVAELTGREPVSFTEFARRNAKLWAGVGAR